MKDRNYFTTGEFAKLANISKQTLIFYDKIGVFSPKYKDDKNFRYYSINQFDTLVILLDLRDIGLSLDIIKEYLKDRNPNKSLELLKKESESIREQIKNLHILNNKIETKISLIEKGLKEDNNLKPYIKECEEEYFIISNVDSDDSKVITMGVVNFINYCNDKGYLNSGYQIGVIVKKEDFCQGNSTKIFAIFLKVDNKIHHKDLIIKPKGIYGCINHKGRYDETANSYKKLLKYIENKGYEIVGDSYENGLLDYFSCNVEEELLTEISIKIKKKN